MSPAADVVPTSAYGHALRVRAAMDNLGAIGGPLIALGLVGLIGVRTAILLSIIPVCSRRWRSSTPSARAQHSPIVSANRSGCKLGPWV